MNTYLVCCISIGATVGGVIGFIGCGVAEMSLSGLTGAGIFAMVGVVLGYATSAWRASTDPVHPYAKPRKSVRDESHTRDE